MISEDVDQALRDFFRWAEDNDPSNIGYPEQTPFRRLLGGGIGSAGLSDDEAGIISYAIGQLKLDNPAAHRIIMRLYRDKKSIRQLALRKEGGRDTLGRLAGEGREFIRGFVFGSSIYRKKVAGPPFETPEKRVL